MAQIIASGPGSEQLSWTETMEGPEAVKKLLTETWPDRRRTVDIESLIPRLMPLAVEEEALQRGHDAEHRYNLRAARSADEVRRRRTALHVVKPAAQMNPSHA
jgi:hypothetical protein